MANESGLSGTSLVGAKVPPQNLDAEVSVLGALLLDQYAIVKVADLLTADDFYDRRHRLIYESLLTLFEKRQPLDALTLKSRLEDTDQLTNAGGASYIASLVNAVSTATHVVNHAEIVRQKAVLRRLITAANNISQLGYQEDEDVDILLDKAEQTLFSVSQQFLQQNFVGIRSVLAQTFERINELTEHKGQLRGLSTGFRALDNVLAGLQKSDLVILAARPSIGKTSLALNLALSAAVEHQAKVGLFSLEMSADQLTDRLLCMLGNIDAWRLRTGNLTDADFSRLHEAMGQLAEANIYIDDSPFVNVMEMRARARRLQMEHGLDFLVIDYLQLMEGSARSSGSIDNRVQEVSYISRSLKALARELNIPILALSQLSRAVEQRSPKIPQLADLRESGCLTGDTFIERADTGERVPIKELVGKEGFYVWALNKDWKLVPSRVSKVFTSGVKKVWRLRFRSGKTIKASANHKFQTIAGWQQLDELTIGQRLATPRCYPGDYAENPNYSDSLLIFLAHMLGDGCYVKNQPIHYTSQDLVNIKAVAQAAEQVFGIKPRTIKQKNWYHVYLPSPYRLARGRYHPFRKWLLKEQLDLAHSYEKKLPATLTTCSNRQLSLFLHHLWSTDCCLQVTNDQVTIYYATSSYQLAKQLSHLLLRLDIRSVIRKVAQKKGNQTYRPQYHLVIQSTPGQRQFLTLVGCFGRRGQSVEAACQVLQSKTSNPNLDILGKEAWAKLIEPAKQAVGMSWRGLAAALESSYSGSSLFNSGIGRDRLQRIAQALRSQKLLSLSQSNVFWDELVAIEPLGEQEVFDVTVPEEHNLVANDIIVHNSIEQDADVVLFIYREDFYDPDSERKNMAEILIAKHRNGPTGKVDLYFKKEQTKFLDIDTSHHEGVVDVYEQAGGAGNEVEVDPNEAENTN